MSLALDGDSARVYLRRTGTNCHRARWITYKRSQTPEFAPHLSPILPHRSPHFTISAVFVLASDCRPRSSSSSTGERRHGRGNNASHGRATHASQRGRAWPNEPSIPPDWEDGDETMAAERICVRRSSRVLQTLRRPLIGRWIPGDLTTATF